MESISTLILIAVIVLLIVILNKINSQSAENQDAFKKLHAKLNFLKAELEKKSIAVEQPVIAEKPIEKEISKSESEAAKDIVVVQTHEIDSAIHSLDDHKELISSVADKPKEVVASYAAPKPTQPKVVLPPKKSWIETFKENNPDIEKFIGENLINKIGILILVLGISFFVKFAIDKNWINEPARVAIGILAGALVMGVAHKLMSNYKAFSSVFVAGAISIFYFTIAIAFHDYHLFSQTVAFIIMTIITAFSVLISVKYDRQELAVLSLIGGFAVPFMVSTGEGNYIVLFTYIAILNIGMLVIAYFKKWNLVTLLAFIFTSILLVSWYSKELSANTLPHKGALFFATLFYFIFSIATVINNIRNKGIFSKIEYFIIIANTFFFFGLGMGIITNWGVNIKGLFTILLAVYNLIYAGILYKKFGLDKNAIYLLLALTLTFVTLTIPIQFNGNYITLFWACEAVVLFFLSQKSKISSFKIPAILVQILMLFSLFIDWAKNYNSSDVKLNIILNPIFITGIVAIGSLIFTYKLLEKETEDSKIYSITFNPNLYRKIIQITLVLVTYFVGILEVNHQANHYCINQQSACAFPVLYHYLFSAALIYFALKVNVSNSIKGAFILAAANIVLYILMFFRLSSAELIENMQLNIHSHSAFVVHYFILACLAYFGYVIVLISIKKPAPFSFLHSKIALWIFAFTIVYVLSNEVMIHGLYLSKDAVSQAELTKNFPKTSNYDFDKTYFIENKVDDLKIQIIKIGYPILWGILSFVFLIIGIKRQWKQLRIIALSLLGITILKLFTYDINDVSETGKIVAFILLGVLILIISFVYQKIKKLVVDEPKKPSNE